MGFRVLDAHGGLKTSYLPQASEVTITTTGNIDDLDFSNASTIRMNNASLSTIRGLKAGTAGQRVVIVSIGAGAVVLADQNAGSVAANRLITGISGSVSIPAGLGSATLSYDGTTARWRLVAANVTQLRSRGFTNAGQTILNNTTTPLNFEVNSYDVGGIHSTSVNTQRFVVPAGGAGLWLLSGSISLLTTTAARFIAAICKNSESGGAIAQMDLQFTPASPGLLLSVATTDVAADGDYYEMQVFQNTGSSVSVNTGSTSGFFAAARVS